MEFLIMPNEATKKVLEEVNKTLKKTHDETLDQVKELLANGKKETDEIVLPKFVVTRIK